MNDSVFSDERFFHLMVQASPAGMVIADESGSIILANPQSESIFGYGKGELVGLSVERLIPPAHSPSHVAHRARYLSNPVPRSMALGRDLFAMRKDGSQVAVDISLHPIETERGMFVLANILDATERRQAVVRRESQHAIERLALMGQLAGGVAHEIRTPLCVIRNNVYYLRLFAEKLGPEGAECLQEMDEAVGKAERIVSELLDYTRDGPARMELTSLQDRIATVLSQSDLPAGIEVRLPENEGDWGVRADAEQIERVLANLVGNAVQAMGGEGQIEIRLGEHQDVVWVEVADSGPGISPTQKERVFEPLFTTKPSGIGLGLALSKRYAEGHGGTLTVRDNVPGGACFRLTLRRDPDPQGETDPHGVPDPPVEPGSQDSPGHENAGHGNGLPPETKS